ncbi:tape measure protein [Candidatus Pacearchaeota archaeon]|nr:tape measure protein [Candidatus Pacearchaeota archaeon]
MIVRELITKLGFNIDQSKLANFDRQIGTLKGQLEGVSRNLNRIGNQLIGVGGRLTLFLTTPLLAANIAAIKVAATFEQLDISFTTMLGSAEEANKLIQEMFAFAAKTPFEIKNIGPVVKQLLAFGIVKDEIIPTLRILGDVAAGLSVPIQRIALNFGQVKAQTKLTGRELRDFAIAGVPLLDELANNLGKTTAEIKNLITTGDISFKMVEDAFKSMAGEGGRFNNLMAKQAKTLGGLFSNLLDNLFLAAGGFGEVIVEILQLKRAIGSLTVTIGKLLKSFQELNKFWKVTILFITAFLILFGPFLVIAGLAVKTIAFLASGFLLLKTALGLATLSAGGFNAVMLLLPAIILAVVAAFALLVEDIFIWATGGESLIGDLLGPWKEWQDTMTGFLQGVGSAIYNLVHGDFEELIEKGKFLAKIFGFFFEDLFKFDEQAEKLIAEVGKRPIGKRPVGEALTWPQRFAVIDAPPGGFTRLSGMANRPGGNVTVNTTMNTEVILAPGEGGTPEDIADKVNEVLGKKIDETIEANLTP